MEIQGQGQKLSECSHALGKDKIWTAQRSNEIATFDIVSSLKNKQEYSFSVFLFIQGILNNAHNKYYCYYYYYYYYYKWVGYI